MARMHSRARGKAGSKKPYRTSPPEWVSYDKKEIEELVVKFGKQGKTSSQIGLILRDEHGIPDVKLSTGKNVFQILSAHGITSRLPEDLVSLLKTVVKVSEHNKNNPKDTSAKRGAQLAEAKIKRLAKYYRRTGKIPKDWKFDIEQARLLVK